MRLNGGKVGHQAERLDIAPQGRHRVRTWRLSDRAQVTFSCPPRFSGRLKCPKSNSCQQWAQALSRALCLRHNLMFSCSKSLNGGELSIHTMPSLGNPLIKGTPPRKMLVCIIINHDAEWFGYNHSVKTPKGCGNLKKGKHFFLHCLKACTMCSMLLVTSEVLAALDLYPTLWLLLSSTKMCEALYWTRTLNMSKLNFLGK